VPESTPAGFCVFLLDPDSESKLCEKPDPDPESLFSFGSSRSLHSHFLSNNVGKFPVGSMVPEPEQESDSQISKIPDLESKILKQERSRSLKK